MELKRYRQIVGLFAAVLVVIPTMVTGDAMPLGAVQFDFAYERLDYLSAFRFDRNDHQLGMYCGDQLLPDSGHLNRIFAPQPNRITTFYSLDESMSARQSVKPGSFEIFHAGFAVAPSERIYLFGNFKLDERQANDPTYTGKKWRGLAGSVENAFLSYRTGELHLTLGRYASFWGGYRSLLFSPDLPLDGFGYSYRWGKFTLSYRLARLNSLFDENNNAEFINRYLAAHRLDLHLSEKLRIALFETVLFGGVGRQVEFFYLNPIISFHAAQMNESVDDNILIGFDYDYKFAPGKKLYGQLLVDDLQVDKRIAGDQEPNQYAFLAGIFYGKIAKELDLRFEYTRVTNWTFNQHEPKNRYLHHSSPITNLSGNDFDQATMLLSRWFRPDILLGIGLSFRRQGEGRIENDWTSPWLLATSDYEEKFPSGVVEQTISVSLRGSGYLHHLLFFSSEMGWQETDNVSNILGANEGTPFFKLTLSTMADIGFSAK